MTQIDHLHGNAQAVGNTSMLPNNGRRGIGNLAGLILSTRGDQLDRLADLGDGRRRFFCCR
jgi:hypothetical protein